jgi:catechol 2,3-dioxygenase-like lactoylglutathione lyase family enzyme
MATKKKKTATKARTARKRPKRKQPETLRMRTATPSYTVDDLDKSLRWYRDVMGFVIGDRWEEGGKLLGVEMVAGDVTFYLTQDDWKKGRNRVKGEGFRIYCTTAQDVDGLAKLVKARGGTLDREPNTEMGSRNFAVVDPDGYRISIGAVGKK